MRKENLKENMGIMNLPKLRILMLIDVYGWAFDFNARGIVKHSKHSYVVKKASEVTQSDQGKYDVIFPFNYDVWTCTGKRRIWLSRKNHMPKYCVGVRSGELDGRLRHKSIHGSHQKIYNFDGIGCNSVKTYRDVKKEFSGLNVHYTPNGVDTEVFKPFPLTERFNVGWAGTVERGCKRVSLIRQLKYPVRIKCNRFGKYFTRNISRKPMVNFYKNIDCLVILSTSEGMNNVVLEACAMGLPVVSTAVGDTPHLISAEWLIPVNPPSLVLKEANKRLDILKNDLKLRQKVGRSNREKIIKNWSWHIASRYYEKMFESVL